MQAVTEQTYAYTEKVFTYTQDGVTLVEGSAPSVRSLKKAMSYKQLLRIAIDRRLRKELEDFNLGRKSCKKRSSIMSGWHSKGCVV